MTYQTLYNGMKTLGELLGLLQILHPYNLRYGGGNAFNSSGECFGWPETLLDQSPPTSASPRTAAALPFHCPAVH